MKSARRTAAHQTSFHYHTYTPSSSSLTPPRLLSLSLSLSPPFLDLFFLAFLPFRVYRFPRVFLLVCTNVELKFFGPHSYFPRFPSSASKNLQFYIYFFPANSARADTISPSRPIQYYSPFLCSLVRIRRRRRRRICLISNFAQIP